MTFFLEETLLVSDIQYRGKKHVIMLCVICYQHTIQLTKYTST